MQSKDGVRLQFVGKESVWHDHLVRDKALGQMLLERKAESGETGKLFGEKIVDGKMDFWS